MIHVSLSGIKTLSFSTMFVSSVSILDIATYILGWTAKQAIRPKRYKHGGKWKTLYSIKKTSDFIAKGFSHGSNSVS